MNPNFPLREPETHSPGAFSAREGWRAIARAFPRMLSAAATREKSPQDSEQATEPMSLEARWQLLAGVRRAQFATAADGCAVALADHTGQFVCRARAGRIAPDVGATVESDRGITGECIRTGAPVLCRDATADARVDGEVCRRLGIYSMAAVPVMDTGRVVGALEVFAERAAAFDEREIRLLTQAAASLLKTPAGSTRATAGGATVIPAFAPSPMQRVWARATAFSDVAREKLGRWTAYDWGLFALVAALSVTVAVVIAMSARRSAQTPPPPIAATTISKPAAPTGPLPGLSAVRVKSHRDFSAIAVMLSGPARYQTARLHNPERIEFTIDAELTGALLRGGAAGRTIEVNDGIVRRIEVVPDANVHARVIVQLADAADYSAVPSTAAPYRINIVVQRATKQK